MRLLVLGGSLFVGRAVVEAALQRGWTVTTYNWDEAGSGPPGVEQLFGDRTRPADLEVLRDRGWDAVVDTWAGRAQAVRDAAAVLAGSVGHYSYISTLMVYDWPPPAPLTEAAPLRRPTPGSRTEGYPARKAAAERAVTAAFGDRALLTRPGLVLGPSEHPGRLPRWLLRLRQLKYGQQLLAPGAAGRQLQYVDARDLAAWVLDAAQGARSGAYNLACPPGHADMGALLAACAEVTGATARPVWVDEDWLAAAGVRSWTELPLWVPEKGDGAGIYDIDGAAAQAAGAVYRPLRETVADTWAWLEPIAEQDLDAAVHRSEWLDPQQEERLLEAWQLRQERRYRGSRPAASK